MVTSANGSVRPMTEITVSPVGSGGNVTDWPVICGAMASWTTVKLLEVSEVTAGNGGSLGRASNVKALGELATSGTLTRPSPVPFRLVVTSVAPKLLVAL